jgi:hypothetical protein
LKEHVKIEGTGKIWGTGQKMGLANNGFRSQILKSQILVSKGRIPRGC